MQALVRSTWKLLCSVFVQCAISVYEDIGVSQNTWPPWANEVWALIRQGYQKCIAMKLSGHVQFMNFKVCKNFLKKSATRRR